MSNLSHLAVLTAKHHNIEQQIDNAYNQRKNNEVINLLKKQRLLLKEKMAILESCTS